MLKWRLWVKITITFRQITIGRQIETQQGIPNVVLPPIMGSYYRENCNDILSLLRRHPAFEIFTPNRASQAELQMFALIKSVSTAVVAVAKCQQRLEEKIDILIQWCNDSTNASSSIAHSIYCSLRQHTQICVYVGTHNYMIFIHLFVSFRQ